MKLVTVRDFIEFHKNLNFKNNLLDHIKIILGKYSFDATETLGDLKRDVEEWLDDEEYASNLNDIFGDNFTDNSDETIYEFFGDIDIKSVEISQDEIYLTIGTGEE